MQDLVDFVLENLPAAPARVLEVGCGEGDLARVLHKEDYDVVAVDPDAPEGPFFRRQGIEEFTSAERFHAVVAVRSLHPLKPLGAVLDRIAGMMQPTGVLVLEEFSWDRLDRETAAWFYTQRRVLASRGGPRAPERISDLEEEWGAQHDSLHGYDDLRREIDARFEERSFSWTPYLYTFLDGLDDVQDDEQKLIEGGGIRAVGFRYVGVLK